MVRGIKTLVLILAFLVFLQGLISTFYKVGYDDDSLAASIDGPTRLSAAPVEQKAVTSPASGLQSHHNHMSEAEILSRVRAITESRPIWIVIKCRGEMGNHLLFRAHGFALAKFALSNFGIHTQLQFIAPGRIDKKKAEETVQTIQTCFSNIQHSDLRWDLDHQASLENQYRALGEVANSFIIDADTMQRSAIASKFQTLQKLILTSEAHPKSDFLPEQDIVHSLIQPPFITVLSIAMLNRDLMDEYYTEIRETFAFDDRKCCGTKWPSVDETVFHFRNFKHEMRGQKMRPEYAELNPDVFAMNDLLKHKSQVTVLSRFADKKAKVMNFVRSLHQHGINATFTGNTENPMHDFCYMKNASTLVAPAGSTFSFLAAYLGKAQATFYAVRYPEFHESSYFDSFFYNWTNFSRARYKILDVKSG